MPILAFTGKSYTGKDKSSNIVCGLDPRFSRRAFADQVKFEFCDLCSISPKELQEHKEEIRPHLIAYAEHKKEKDSYYWAKKLFETFNKEDYIVISDLRFLEELELVVKNKGIVYKMQADPAVRKYRGWIPNPEVDTHRSETDLDLSPYTFFSLTKGGGIFNNELDSDQKLRSQIYRILGIHFE